jgi:biopolymer transport protein ExbD
MKATKVKRTADAQIPTASMADIAFLLIIFFMVTTVHELDRTDVNLPLSMMREEAEKGAAIVAMAEEDGQYEYHFSDGEGTSHLVGGPEDIYLEASVLTASDPKKQFIFKADGTARFEKVDELLDNLRKADVTRVILLSQQATTGSSGDQP